MGFEHHPYDAKKIRAVLQPFTGASVFLPLTILTIDVALYVIALYAAVSAHNIAIRLLCSAAAGLFIGLLFILGHDACHGSLTPSAKLNQTIGRIVFIPSAHAFSLWRLGHNRIHHRYTNLKEIDYVWRPFSKTEFESLPLHRRILERIYRTVPGHCLYYLYEIWWKKMFFASSAEVDERKREYIFDSALVIFGNAMMVGLILLISQRHHQFWLISLLLGWCLPFVVWNWLMGFMIYQHHTHPSVAWFDNADEWEYWESQIEGTTHIKFPRLFNFILHNIMEHTAHHALTGIPLYKLKSAQDQLERNLVARILVVQWTVSDYLQTVARCKLYDYGNHRWLDFDGNPTCASAVDSTARNTLSGVGAGFT